MSDMISDIKKYVETKAEEKEVGDDDTGVMVLDQRKKMAGRRLVTV